MDLLGPQFVWRQVTYRPIVSEVTRHTAKRVTSAVHICGLLMAGTRGIELSRHSWRWAPACSSCTEGLRPSLGKYGAFVGDSRCCTFERAAYASGLYVRLITV